MEPTYAQALEQMVEALDGVVQALNEATFKKEETNEPRCDGKCNCRGLNLFPID